MVYCYLVQCDVAFHGGNVPRVTASLGRLEMVIKVLIEESEAHEDLVKSELLNDLYYTPREQLFVLF